ncbi:Prefoldin subunit beta [uncultured archaeon]|nr:Prefoldin subunit beta [uncultured archaeon]
MDQEEQRVLVLDFERNRQLLMNVSAQKQQIAYQLEMINSSLEEMGKSKEKMVYKVVGNVLFPKDAKEMEKELKEKKESSELRAKTIDKQEETLIKKLNSIRAKIEGTQKEEEQEKSEKSEKKKK